jgi:hypothetical protein
VLSAVAPTPYLAELARRRHLTIAADLTGGRSIVPPRTGLGEKELATSVGRDLNVTSSGRQWIASLYSNIFRAERTSAHP